MVNKTLLMDMPDEVAERIVEAFWLRQDDGEKLHNVRFINIHQHNACNHTMTGIVVVDGQDYGFVMESGDRNGTVVIEYAPAEECSQVYSYEPPEPTRYMFVPKDDFLEQHNPTMWKVYLYWKEQAWFKDKLKDYHYDLHFQPGGVIKKHYRDWAAMKGLKIVVDPSSYR